MKKALAAVAARAPVVWVISWFHSEEAVATAGAQPWPNGMGTLDSLAKRLPAISANDASSKLMRLARAAEECDEVARQLDRTRSPGR